MAETKIEDEKAAVYEEAKLLGITIPKTSMAGFKAKKPEDIAKETARVEKEVIGILKIAIAKKKADAKLKPIDRRRALLTARFRAVRSRTRAHTYSNKNVEAWLEEYKLIESNPRAWNKATENGKKPYVPGNKKKKTAKDILDGMNLD
jgi:hypothetical protein